MHVLWPHPHWTRRERRSKLGRENPIVATGLYTLHATSNTLSNMCQNGTWLHLFALRMVPRVSVDEASLVRSQKLKLFLRDQCM